METPSRLFVTALIAAAPLSGIPAAARAGSPVELTSGQLDRITAGGVTVGADANSLATGVVAFGLTNSNSTVGTNPNANSVLSSQAGLAVGEAQSFGTNLAAQGVPPAQSTTSVTTGGAADGNLVVTISNNKALSALGVTIQVGFTAAYGAFALGF